MKFCPKCGSVIVPGNGVCVNCGEPLQMAVPVSPQQSISMPKPVSQTLSIEPVVQAVTVPTNTVPMPVMEESNIVNSVAPSNVQSIVTSDVEINPNVIDNSVNVNYNNVANESVGTVTGSIASAQTNLTTITPVIASPLVENNLAPVVAEIPQKEESLTPEPPTEVKLDEKALASKQELTPEQKEKQFNKITTIIILCVSVISVIINAIFVIKSVSKANIEAETTVAHATKYNYEGFYFSIPTGVIASVEDNAFVLKDNEETWSAVITVQNGTYSSLVSNKSQIISYYETYGYNATPISEKVVSGTSFVTTEVLIGSQNVLVAYAKASGTKIYGVIYMNELGTYDNSSLKTVGEILSSAINSGYDSSMPEGFTIDMFEKTFEVAK